SRKASRRFTPRCEWKYRRSLRIHLCDKDLMSSSLRTSSAYFAECPADLSRALSCSISWEDLAYCCHAWTSIDADRAFGPSNLLATGVTCGKWSRRSNSSKLRTTSCAVCAVSADHPDRGRTAPHRTRQGQSRRARHRENDRALFFSQIRKIKAAFEQ